MKKKYLTLGIFLPYYVLAQNLTILEEIPVITQGEKRSNSLNIDLQKEEQHQSNSFLDLFKKESSMEVGGGSVNVQRLYIRGIESTNLNITLDGAKQGKNVFQHKANVLGFNPDLLKVIDVKTASDASNGSALGGSIIMNTKDAQDFVSGDKTKGAIFKAGYHTNTNTKLGSITAYEVFNDNFGAIVSVSGVNNDNYKDGQNNELYGTAYKDRDYLVKLSLLDYKDHDLRLTLSQNENSGDFQWAKLGSDAGIHNPNGPIKLEKVYSTTTSYALQHNYNPSDLINLDSNLNLSNVNVNRKDNDKKYDNNTIGLKVQNHFDFNFSKTNNRFSIGAEIQDEKGVDKGANLSEVKSQNQALFIQNRTTFDDLNIYYGLRFDEYFLETGFGETTNHSYSPNLGFDYALNETSKIYANYGKNTRMTGVVPFTWLTDIKANTTYSSKLKPEESAKYELGYKYELNNLFLDDDYLNFNASIFKTSIENVIIAKDITGGSGEGGKTLVDLYNSSNEFESKGYELKVSYNYDKYFSSLAFTKIDANTINDNSSSTTGIDESITIRRIGAYDSKKLVFNTGLELTNAIYIDYTLNAVAGLNDPIQRAGYVTHDASLKYKPSSNSSWTYFVAVNNISDKYYANHSTIATKSSPDVYRNEMGRDFRFSIKYEF